jgi:hypothetical protein
LEPIPAIHCKPEYQLLPFGGRLGNFHYLDQYVLIGSGKLLEESTNQLASVPAVRRFNTGIQVFYFWGIASVASTK